MHLLLALLLTFPIIAATRVGGMGMTVILPDGWRVVTPEEVPTPKSFNRVVVLSPDTNQLRTMIQISRLPSAPDMKRPMPEIMRSIGIRSDLQPRERTIANTPAIEIDRTVNSIPLRQFLIVRGETAYIITAGRNTETDAVIDDLLASIEFMKSVRIEAGGISMELPDGWRQIERDEAQARATKVQDQTPPGRRAKRPRRPTC